MLPLIDEDVDTLLGAKFFSKLDFSSGNWQVEMKEDEEKAALTFGNIYISYFYKCNSVAFGLTNAPATFQGPKDCCMGSSIWRSASYY